MSHFSNTTASPNVHVLSRDFFMPQLNRHRRIWLYLPPNYEQSGLRYPVIYMHDGQNLFDAHTAYAGEWKVDKTLNRLHRQGDKGAIVVGIDNGGEHRLHEYAPWHRAKMGGGEGNPYSDFLAHTLKPYIDAHFRTLPGRAHTAILGSSMGGLISFYTGLKHAEVFGKIGALSPSFWFNRELYDWTRQRAPHPEGSRIVMLGSRTESAYMERNMAHICGALLQAGHTPHLLTVVARARGKHNEIFWGREFKYVYTQLFGYDTKFR